MNISRDISGDITITFRYEQAIVEKIRKIQGRRWHPVLQSGGGASARVGIDAPRCNYPLKFGINVAPECNCEQDICSLRAETNKKEEKKC